jgi:hypothetical protein
MKEVKNAIRAASAIMTVTAGLKGTNQWALTVAGSRIVLAPQASSQD